MTTVSGIAGRQRTGGYLPAVDTAGLRQLPGRIPPGRSGPGRPGPGRVGPGDAPGGLARLSAAAVRWTAMPALALPTIEGYLLNLHPLASKVPAALFMLVFVVDRVLIRPRRPAFHPIQAAILLLFAVVIISTLANSAEGNSIAYVIRWAPFLLVTLALVDTIARDLPPLWAVIAILTTTAIAAGGALISVVASGNPRATGPLEDPNDLAYVLVSAVPIALLLPGLAARRFRVGRAVRVRSHRWVEVMSLATAGLLMAGAAATFSRGGAIATGLAFGLLALRGVLPWRKLGVLLLLAVLTGTLLVASVGPFLQQALNEKLFVAGNNIQTRELRWSAAVAMIGDAPVFGVGPGNFQREYVRYGGNAELQESYPVAHSMYLEVGAELGVTGLFAFVSVLAIALLATEDLTRAGPAKTRLLGHALQASLVAALTASVFLSEQYYMTLWALVAVSCAAAMRNRAAAPTPW